MFDRNWCIPKHQGQCFIGLAECSAFSSDVRKKKSLLEFVQSHQTFCFALNEMYLNISPYVCVCVLRLMKTSFNAYSPTLWKKEEKNNRNITNVYVLFGCYFLSFFCFVYLSKILQREKLQLCNEKN